jgi:transcriptional regulator with XRE-family HTH domain
MTQTTTIDQQLVASRIRAALKRAGVTANDAAAALGVTRRAVEHWMSGHRRPRA